MRPCKLGVLFCLVSCSSIFWAKQPKTAAKPAPGNPAPRITIAVDATEAPRKIFHSWLQIEAAPGPLTLFYPKWIPGEHGPDGPVGDVAGLKIFSGGKEISWRRDPVEMFAIHCQVPAGASSVEVHMDYLSPASSLGFSAGASATAKLAVISWNQVLMYPAGFKAAEITYSPSLMLPEGWKYATALTTASENGNKISFAPVSLETLVDSPVLSGEYLRKIPLSEGEAPVSLDVAADTAGSLEITPEHLAHLKGLVTETNLLFGAHHYDHYDFLFTLSDNTAHFGLEHHQSSDNRTSERSLVRNEERILSAGLLPHEYVHSWNGKYRRPAGLAVSNYDQPMVGDLLWVYEGLTTYLGSVLTARSGLLTPELSREGLAEDAAIMDRARPGRTWRDLQDTATGAQTLFGSRRNGAWVSWRRSTDFYGESELIWLEADVIIRQQTHGQKSLDDFCRLFHGAPSTPPEVKPYTFDDIVAAMDQVAPYDWRTFFTERLQSHGPGAPLGGIQASGWKLVYDSSRPAILRTAEEARDHADFMFSLGFTVNNTDHTMPDVIHGSPAYQAGIGPGMVLVAVNGRAYKRDILRDALRQAQDSSQPIELLVRNGDYYSTYKVDYHGGERYPHLERDPSKPDVLSDILAPHTK